MHFLQYNHSHQTHVELLGSIVFLCLLHFSSLFSLQDETNVTVWRCVCCQTVPVCQSHSLIIIKACLYETKQTC